MARRIDVVQPVIADEAVLPQHRVVHGMGAGIAPEAVEIVLRQRRAGTADPRDDLVMTAATATFGNNTADAVELEVTQLSAASLSIPNLNIRMLQGGYTAADYDCLPL